jgi:tetratricopeptide (TPR) repeat protein
VAARLRLAEALVHSLRGMDEEGLATLHEAERIALAAEDRAAAAQARAEIGYVDFLRARYDRAERWLTDALAVADGSPAITARVTTYLGGVESDRAGYPRARELLERAAGLAHAAADPRTEAYALSMLGRLDALRRLASRTGMKEMTVRAMRHSAALGNAGDRDAAMLLAADIQNPVLDALLGT